MKKKLLGIALMLSLVFVIPNTTHASVIGDIYQDLYGKVMVVLSKVESMVVNNKIENVALSKQAIQLLQIMLLQQQQQQIQQQMEQQRVAQIAAQQAAKATVSVGVANPVVATSSATVVATTTSVTSTATTTTTDSEVGSVSASSTASVSNTNINATSTSNNVSTSSDLQIIATSSATVVVTTTPVASTVTTTTTDSDQVAKKATLSAYVDSLQADVTSLTNQVTYLLQAYSNKKTNKNIKPAILINIQKLYSQLITENSQLSTAKTQLESMSSGSSGGSGGISVSPASINFGTFKVNYNNRYGGSLTSTATIINSGNKATYISLGTSDSTRFSAVFPDSESHDNESYTLNPGSSININLYYYSNISNPSHKCCSMKGLGSSTGYAYVYVDGTLKVTIPLYGSSSGSYSWNSGTIYY